MKVSRNGADGSIKIIHDSVENVDISDATAIFLYLVPEGMKAIQDKLRAAVLERGVRVVAHVFSVPGLVPTEVSLVCVCLCVRDLWDPQCFTFCSIVLQTILYKNIIKIYLYERPTANMGTSAAASVVGDRDTNIR